MEEKGHNDSLSSLRSVIGSHSRASIAIFSFICIIALAVAVIIAVSAVLLCFPVSVIEIDGYSRYTYGEIISGSGIDQGSRLYFINREKAESRLFAACPYIGQAEIEVCFPNRIIIHISEHEEVFAVSCEGGIAYLDPDFRVIEISAEAPEYEYFDSVFIGLSDTVECDIGDTLTGEQIERARAVLDALDASDFYENINVIDVSDKYNGYVIADKRLKFCFGSMVDIDDKVGHCAEVYSTAEIPEGMALIFTSVDGSFALTRTVDAKILREEFYFCKN